MSNKYVGIDANNIGPSTSLADNSLHMDNLAYVTAGPDDTAIFCGPSRIRNPAGNKPITLADTMYNIGMVQTAQVQSTVPLRYLKAIGTRRKMPIRDNADHYFTISRMAFNGNNFLKSLYLSLLEANPTLAGSNFSYPPLQSNASLFKNVAQLYDLDSDLFYIPFGIGIAMENRANQQLGSIYLECCMIQSWSIAIVVGQNFVVENVVIGLDRIVPFKDNTISDQEKVAEFKKFEAVRRAYLQAA